MECVACHTTLIDDAVFCPRCGARQPFAPEGVAKPEYSAFISYRRVPRDADVARAIQKAIETYRLPKDVAAKSPFALGGRRLGKAFRDEDELAASPSLPESIRNALRKSSALVIVCSPSTTESEWVQREIETFASYHGRDRIFPVLAEGASADVIPKTLQERVVIENGRIVGTEHASPLAADFRLETSNGAAAKGGGKPGRAAARGKARAEAVRLIAALAGCSYDELRRRDQARRRKRVAAVAAAAVVIAVAIGALAVNAGARNRDALIAESRQLAAESRELFAAGDRYGAIEAALDALPSSESDASRPLVPEAQAALEEALEVHPDGSSMWLSSYLLETDSGITSIATSEEYGWYGIREADGTIKTYSLATGRALAACTFSDDVARGNPETTPCKLKAAGERLVVYEGNDEPVLACFSAFSGEVEWQQTRLPADAIDVAPDNSGVDITYLDADGTLYSAVFDMETGEVLGTSQIKNTRFGPEPKRVSCAIGGRLADLYVLVDGTLAYVNLETDEISYAQAAHSMPSGLRYSAGTIVVASGDVAADGDSVEYAIEGFDAGLNRTWIHEGESVSELLDLKGEIGTGAWAGAMPAIHYFMDAGRPCVACSAGKSAFVFALDDGEEVYRLDAKSTVVGATPLMTGQGESDALFVATSDGSLNIYDPAGRLSEGLERIGALQFPSPIVYCGTFISVRGYAVALGKPASPDNQLLAYRSDMRRDEQPDRTYTLDELIDRAHEVLSEV